MPTAPLVLVRRFHHAGFNGIAMNVAEQSDEIVRVAHWLATEAVVEKWAKPIVALVEITHIRHTDALHSGGKRFRALRQKQMDVVAHQTIGVNVAIWRKRLVIFILWICELAKYFDELAAILVVGKHSTSVYTA